MTDQPRELGAALTERFTDRWDVRVEGGRLQMVPHRVVRPPVRQSCPAPADVVALLRQQLAAAGLRTADVLLPLRWNRDTDLTISAVQALDPWLKDRRPYVWREGFLPQPVVRFTGERRPDGRLADGYLTAFVNISYVQRVSSVSQHVALLDDWLTALSAVGVHAGRLRIEGDLQVWQRPPVAGITLFLRCDGRDFGDAVLLWHRDDPAFLGTDLGTGLERLRWHLGARSWKHAAFGDLAHLHDTELLDRTRAATLLIMAGIRPGARGPAAALRSLAAGVDPRLAATGLGRLVRKHSRYWRDVGMQGPAWPITATVLEDEVLKQSVGAAA
jgi:hypothetical protein